MASQENINWAIYDSLPPEEAQYQLAHIHESKMASVVVTYAICLPILVLANIMRFVSRRIGRTKYGADDWVMLLASVILLFLLGHFILFNASVLINLGTDFSNLRRGPAYTWYAQL